MTRGEAIDRAAAALTAAEETEDRLAYAKVAIAESWLNIARLVGEAPEVVE